MKMIKTNLSFAMIALHLVFINPSLPETIDESKIEIAYYEEVKDLPNHPEKLLIDVRSPEELAETGKIPNSVNIPLASLHHELSDSLNAEDFKQKYRHEKPSKDSEIIFSCRSGKRAQQAAEIAVKLGYTNVKNYKGSWLDWAKQEGLQQK